ncbi:hypothetical protein MKW92_006653 [Papaver armeniacum]|nr:hypothetical protein MKW92_006653 [Papaver armeniacum]
MDPVFVSATPHVDSGVRSSCQVSFSNGIDIGETWPVPYLGQDSCTQLIVGLFALKPSSICAAEEGPQYFNRFLASNEEGSISG